MRLQLYPITAAFLLSALPTILFAQESCATNGSPFLLSSSETICASNDGPTVVSFSIFNRNDPGDYEIRFPDGSDTTLLGIDGEVTISHAFDFACDNMPGRPSPPRSSSRFFAYRSGLTIRRTDCVDNLGQQSTGSYEFNVIPNPILAVDNTNTECVEAPFAVSLTGVICSQNLVQRYQWLIDGEVIPGATDPELDDFVFPDTGRYVMTLQAFDYFNCGPFSFDKEIHITASAQITADVSIDESQLCDPVVTVLVSNVFSNVDSFRWDTQDAEVTFSDPTVAEPTITIDNTMAGRRRFRLRAYVDDCPPVVRNFTVRTVDGQTIETSEPIVGCIDVPVLLCDFLEYRPRPANITWNANDPAVTVQDGDTRCPRVTFPASGNYTLTATGEDICGQAFSITLPARVLDDSPVVANFAPIDTLCESSPIVDLLDYLSPSGNVTACDGPGVRDCTFDPSGLEGANVLSFLDSCENMVTAEIFVLTEGGFSGGNPVVCLGESLDLNAIQAGTFSGPGVTNGVFNSAAVGIGRYDIDFSSTAFCGGRGQFEIRVVEVPIAGFTVANERCADAGAAYAGDQPLRLLSTTDSEVILYRVVETGEEYRDSSDADLTFPATGRYTLRQIVGFAGGGGCLDSTDMTVDVVLPFATDFRVGVDSTSCDSVRLSFRNAAAPEGVTYEWTLPDGSTTASENPELTVVRPFAFQSLLTRVVARNGCFQVTDTLWTDLSPRFQVSFSFLNNNRTVCSDADIELINTSTNFDELTITYPDGRTSGTLPRTFSVTNTTGEVLPYVIRLDGAKGGCAAQRAVDTIFVLPVENRAAFSLDFDDNCSPATVTLNNASTPGGNDFIWWGDGSTPEPVASLGVADHVFTAPRDTTLEITVVSELCGRDTMTRTFLVRGAPPAEIETTAAAVNCVGTPILFSTVDTVGNLSLDWDFGDGRFSNLPRPENVYDRAGTFRVMLEVSNPNGCRTLDSTEVRIDDYNGPPLVVDLPPTICVDGALPVTVTSSGEATEFDYGNGLVSRGLIDRPYQIAGDYRLRVIAIDAAGCQTDTSALISVLPQFSVAIQPDEGTIAVDFGDEVQLSFQSEPVRQLDSIEWQGDSIRSPNAQFTSVFPLSDGRYSLRVTDEFGCVATDSIFVAVAQNFDERIYAPNVFSPNGDGSNDYFHLWARPNTVRNMSSFRVFTRWGATVYECTDCQPNDVNFRWDGTLNGQPVNPAVYVWVAEIEFVDGTTRQYTGDVALMR